MDENEEFGFRYRLEQEQAKKPNLSADTALTWGEKAASALMPKFLEGNLRGSAVGRAMQGAADPGVAIAQVVGNLAGQGDAVNKSINETEAKYQAARGEAGSTGFDPMRLAGGIAITAPLGGALGGASTIGKGALQGAAFSALQPVNEGDSFWADKAKQIGIGTVTGAVAAPLLGRLSRMIAPEVNPNVSVLQKAKTDMSVGQALGGGFNAMEERAQSIPFLGGAIRDARQRGGDQLERAAFARGGDPIGANINNLGHEGILELKDALKKSYDEVIPKLSVNVLDKGLVNKIANIRGGVQSLPESERVMFDAIIKREIDDRLAPNGVLSGQNLKDAWMSLRDESAKFLKGDPYQKTLGGALKQTFQELKDQISATNPAENVRALKNTDFGYANYKILQRAASGANAIDGRFSPTQLQAAVRSADRSGDKGRMSEGMALMQDLSNAGKSVLTNKVPDSGTAARLMSANTPALLTGLALSPLRVAYNPKVQNMLVALLTKRPDMAPKIANYLREINPALTTGAATAGLLQ